MGQDIPEPALTISFTKQDSFKPDLKGREGVCLPNTHWELVPQERSLIAEGSAPPFYSYKLWEPTQTESNSS